MFVTWLKKMILIIPNVLCDVLCHAESPEPRSGLGEASGSRPGVGHTRPAAEFLCSKPAAPSAPLRGRARSLRGVLRATSLPLPLCFGRQGERHPDVFIFFFIIFFIYLLFGVFPPPRKCLFLGRGRWGSGERFPPSPFILFGKVDT